MLHLIDAVACFLFKVVPDLIFIGATIYFCGVALKAVFGRETRQGLCDPSVPLWNKIRAVWLILNLVGVAFFSISILRLFFYVLGWSDASAATPQGQEDYAIMTSGMEFPDYSWLGHITATIISLLAMGVAALMRGLGIPWLIVGVIFLGIAIFGV